MDIPPFEPTHTTHTITSHKKRSFLTSHISVFILMALIFIISGMSYYVLHADKGKSLVKLTVPQFAPSPTKQPLPSPTLSPTPNPVNGWKLFANKSVSIKHPDRFAVVEKKTTVTAKYPKVYSISSFTDADSTITIAVAKNTQQYTLDTALGNGPLLIYDRSITNGIPIKPIDIAGTQGVIVKDIAVGTTGVAADVIILHNEKIYEITLTPRTADTSTFALMLTTLQLLDQEPADITDSWSIRIDPTYKFSFKYPTPAYAIDFNKVASGSPNLTMVYDNTTVKVDASKFKIDVQDIKNFGESAVTSRAILKLKLEDYVNKKWEYNKAATESAIPNRSVSAIKETAVDGQPAYSFSVTGKYVDDNVAEVLSEEYIFIFTEKNGYKYKIWYPKSHTTFAQIFNSFAFTN